MLAATIANPRSQWLNPIRIYFSLLSPSSLLALCHLELLGKKERKKEMEEAHQLLDVHTKVTHKALLLTIHRPGLFTGLQPTCRGGRGRKRRVNIWWGSQPWHTCHIFIWLITCNSRIPPGLSRSYRKHRCSKNTCPSIKLLATLE